MKKPIILSVLFFIITSISSFGQGVWIEENFNRWGGKLGKIEVNGNVYEIKRGANLRNANLSGANLKGVYFYEVDLKGANLSEADLSKAAFPESTLEGANLFKADLKGARLNGTDLSGVRLDKADLTGAMLIGADLSGANLDLTILTNANLDGATLIGANFFEANLDNANLSDINLFARWEEEVDTDTSFSRSSLKGANLSGAYLKNSDLSLSDCTGANFADADISKSNVIGTNFANTVLKGVDFSDVVIKNANLEKLDLRYANFSGLDLTRVNLAGSNLTGVDLTNTILKDCDLTDAIMIGTKYDSLEGAKADKSLVAISREQLTAIGQNDASIMAEINAMKAQLQTLVAQVAEKDKRIAELEQGGGGQSLEQVLEQVRDARAGSVVLTVDPDGDNITLGLTIEQSDNLIEWTKLDGEMTRTIPIPDGKKFYRFALDK